jgi:hypothetical protein
MFVLERFHNLVIGRPAAALSAFEHWQTKRIKQVARDLVPRIGVKRGDTSKTTKLRRDDVYLDLQTLRQGRKYPEVRLEPHPLHTLDERCRAQLEVVYLTET